MRSIRHQTQSRTPENVYETVFQALKLKQVNAPLMRYDYLYGWHGRTHYLWNFDNDYRHNQTLASVLF